MVDTIKPKVAEYFRQTRRNMSEGGEEVDWTRFIIIMDNKEAIRGFIND